MNKLFYAILALTGLFILQGCDAMNAPPGGSSTEYQVTISAEPPNGGGVSPESGTYQAGSVITLTATPADGWRFERWKGDYSGTKASATITVNSDMAITGVFKKKEYKLTVNTDGKGIVDEQIIKNADTYPQGTVVELTANPHQGWTFVKWKGDLSGSKNPVQITIDQPKTVTAVFKKKSYPLTIKIEGGGAVDEKVIQAQTTDYPYGTKVQLTANPATGWHFDHWEGNLSGSQNPVTITVDEAKTVTAVFVKESYTLTVNIDGQGSVTKEPDQSTYPYNATVTLTADADQGWQFVKWKGDITSTSKQVQVTMTKDKQVTAVFEKKSYKLTVQIDGQGNVTRDPNQNRYEYNTTVTLTADPDNNWYFVEWRGDITSTQNPVQVTMTKSKTVTAVFRKSTGSGHIAGMHLTQSTQDPDDLIPMVAGRDAALRVFLEANKTGSFDHAVNVFINGVKQIHKPAGSLRLHSVHDTASVMNIFVPGHFIQPGLSIKVRTSNGWAFPSGSPHAVTVKNVAEFHVRMIPIYVPDKGKTGEINSGNMDQFFEPVYDMFPLNDYVLELHAPITVDPANSGEEALFNAALSAVNFLRGDEGFPDYFYYGVIPQSGGGIAGTAYVGARSAVGSDELYYEYVMPHELGHNLGRRHAPCGVPGYSDPNYPYHNTIEVPGFEVDSGDLKDPSRFEDLMSYCGPFWVSDYTYEGIMQYRKNENSSNSVSKPPQDVLLLWGRITNNQLTLKPAFRMHAPVSMPQKPGPYTLSGYDKNGHQLFAFSFAGLRVADSGGMHHFMFMVPVERIHIKALQMIKLNARGLQALQHADVPARTAMMKAGAKPEVAAMRISTNLVNFQWKNSQYEMAIVRNAQGQIIGFIYDNTTKIKTNTSKLNVLFSDGVHTIRKKIDL